MKRAFPEMDQYDLALQLLGLQGSSTAAVLQTIRGVINRLERMPNAVGEVARWREMEAAALEVKRDAKAMEVLRALKLGLPYGTSGIFVSKSGFQSGAMDVARVLGIRLYELRKPTDEDWGNTITSVEIHQHLYIPYFKNLKLTLDEEWLVSHVDRDNIPPSGTAFHGDYDIVDEQGNRISSISELINAFLRRASEKETHFVEDFENSFIVHQGQLLKLKSLWGEYGFRVSTDVIKINIEDIVGMILKDTLEGSFRRIDKYDNLIGGKPNA